MTKKLGRDNTQIKDKVVEELAYHLTKIDQLLRENDQRSYTWDNKKSIDMIVNAMCYKSRDFNQANQFASNFNGLFQHVQRETCGLSGTSKPKIGDNAKHFIRTSSEIWLNMRGEGGKRVKGEIQVRAKQHNVPWRFQGDCKDCKFYKIDRDKLFNTCSGCGHENPKFKAVA